MRSGSAADSKLAPVMFMACRMFVVNQDIARPVSRSKGMCIRERFFRRYDATGGANAGIVGIRGAMRIQCVCFRIGHCGSLRTTALLRTVAIRCRGRCADRLRSVALVHHGPFRSRAAILETVSEGSGSALRSDPATQIGDVFLTCFLDHRSFPPRVPGGSVHSLRWRLPCCRLAPSHCFPPAGGRRYRPERA